MKKIYIVTCDKLTFFKTFNSMNEIIDFMVKENKDSFDNLPFSIFGRSENKKYYIDSIILGHRNISEYFTFFIRCIDSEGNRIELD